MQNTELQIQHYNSLVYIPCGYVVLQTVYTELQIQHYNSLVYIPCGYVVLQTV